VVTIALFTAPPFPQYHALLLDCSRYQEHTESDILTSGGRTLSREQTGRTGILVIRARQQDSVINLEAWFDSLAVWRTGGGVRVEPETDGVIGGRFRGVLLPDGAYQSQDTPFVPDPVAAVSNIAGSLDDLFPRLPDTALAVGGQWEGTDFTINRLADGEVEGRRVLRYHLTGDRETATLTMLPDSSSVEARQTQVEDGTFQWDPERGPLRWERAIRATVSIPPGGAFPRGFRTTITQQVELRRMEGGCGDAVQ
jgi:hypothetical protein